jgi:hypothetical protein
MQRWQAGLITLGCVTLGTACVDPVIRAPGADQVRLTTSPGDVATCKPVGNIQVPSGQGATLVLDFEGQIRNRVVGLGGNAGLVTSGQLRAPSEGIAYLCP